MSNGCRMRRPKPGGSVALTAGLGMILISRLVFIYGYLTSLLLSAALVSAISENFMGSINVLVCVDFLIFKCMFNSIYLHKSTLKAAEISEIRCVIHNLQLWNWNCFDSC